MFSALSIRNFRLYWLGLVTLFFAGQLQQPAQAWLAYEITHSPLKLTLVLAMQSVPMILLSLYSGVIIDRIQKRKVIIITQIITAVIALFIAILITTNRIEYWHLLLASFAGGINAAFNMTARNSIVAELVPPERLFNAIAISNAGANAASVAGPAISGILIGVIGVQGAYFTGIGFYIIGIIIISLLPATSTLGRMAVGSVRKNLTEGLNYLRLQKIVVLLLILEMGLTFFGMCYQGLMPVFADLLSLKSEGYGFMLAAAGVGSMLGSLAIASLGNYKRKGTILIVAGILFGVALLVFSNLTGLGKALHVDTARLYIVSLILGAAGIFGTAYSTTSITAIQMNIADEYRGRVTSVYGMVLGFYPIATLVIGAVAESLGAPLALTIAAGCLVLFITVVATISPRLRHLE